MRHVPKLVAAVLCAIALLAAQSQTAINHPKSTAAAAIPSGMSFHYDAQHDQVIADGIRLKPSAMGAPSIAPTTGTLVVTINITALSHFIRGTTYHCSLTAIGGVLDTDNAVVSGGIDTAFGLARWNGVNTLACTLTIPYEWALLPDPAGDRGALLAFGVSAVAPASEGGAVQRSTLQVDGVAPIPPNGATSTFTFNVTL
jgi:hypothetical protein